MAFHLIRFNTDKSANAVTELLKPTDNAPRQSARRLAKLFVQMAGGWFRGDVTLFVGATKATATLTFTDNPANDEAFELGNIVLTAKTSGANGTTQWNLTSGGTAGADAAANAASVAAMVNANTTLSKYLTATSAAGVVTFTCDIPGDIGNALQIADIDLSNATVSEFVTADAGDDGTRTEISLD